MAQQQPIASTSTPDLRVGEERKESCTPYFDALWFCYSPVHQMKQYYTYGTVDDCTGHWRAFYNCLKKRTKFRDQVPEDPNRGKHPLWQIRTHAQARAFWAEEFGHLRTAEEQQSEQGQQQGQQTQQQGEEMRHAGKATLV